MSDKINLELISGSRERVALDLMKYIINVSPRDRQTELKTEEEIIELFTKCYNAASSVPFEEIYPEQ